jgi:hypothetical protein
MKKTLLFATLVVALPVILFAQTPPVSITTNSPPPAVDASLQKKLPTPADFTVLPQEIDLQAKPTTHVTFDGALIRAARAGQFWQAVNPFAPEEFGQGYDNVTVDPHGRQPTGIVLVSVRFGGAGRGHR